MEIFKDIKGYRGLYQISNLGNVKSLDRIIITKNGRKNIIKGKILKQGKLKNGKCNIVLSLNGKCKTFYIHQLVAIAFLGHTPCGYKIVVDHINNISDDNRVENLQLISQRKNCSKDKKGGSSKYVGVSWHKYKELWQSTIQINGVIKHLGYFNNEYEAHLIYEKNINYEF